MATGQLCLVHRHFYVRRQAVLAVYTIYKTFNGELIPEAPSDILAFLREVRGCCAVLCCAVLCCVVLCCAVLCCAVLCCAVLCWCCAVLCCAVLCCAVLCWCCAGCVGAVLCCAVLCAGLCCAGLCCAGLCAGLACHPQRPALLGCGLLGCPSTPSVLVVRFVHPMPCFVRVRRPVFAQESDPTASRNAFLMLFNCAQDLAVSYYLEHLDEVATFGDGFQLVVLELARKVCRTDPAKKSHFIKCIFQMLTSSSPAVVFEAAGTLVAMSSAPSAVRAAAQAYTTLLNNEVRKRVACRNCWWWLLCRRCGFRVCPLAGRSPCCFWLGWASPLLPPPPPPRRPRPSPAPLLSVTCRTASDRLPTRPVLPPLAERQQCEAHCAGAPEPRQENTAARDAGAGHGPAAGTVVAQ